MEHLSADELEELRALLGAEKDSLEEELAEHGRKIGDDWQGTAGGLSPNEADATDAADSMEELTVNIPLVEELEKRYKEVVAAMSRIKEGKYGLDENTGEPIDVERLQANPAARTNI
jgi:RNA polymerase-binding transcription factor DksA